MKDYKKLWKSLAKEGSITAASAYQRCLLKAIAAKSPEKETILLYFLKKAFTPITRASKLRGSGVTPYQGACAGWKGSRFAEKYLIGPDKEPTQLLECIETNEEAELYRNLCDSSFKLLSGHELEDIDRLNAKKNELYSFVFVRQDISIEQQMVQSLHAFGMICQTLDATYDLTKMNVVLCGAKDLTELNEINEYIKQHRLVYLNWYESDLNNELTSLAVMPLKATKKGCLRKFKLLKIGVWTD